MMNSISTLSTMEIHRPLHSLIWIWIVFMARLVIGALVSPTTPSPAPERPVRLKDVRFATGPMVNLAGLTIIATLIALYALFC